MRNYGKLWNSEWNVKPSLFKSEKCRVEQKWIFKSTGFEREPNMEMDSESISKESKKREKGRRNGTYPIKTILHEYLFF